MLDSLETLCQEAIKVTESVAQFLATELGKVTAQAIEEKALNSLVSYVDRNAEMQLVEGLGKLLPEATFLTEEETVAQEDSALQWIIDPLDGTTNFLHQIPVFSISVALQQNGQTVLGIVHEVNHSECFYAWKGGGAYLNGEAIRVSKSEKLADSVLATGFPYYDYDKIKTYLKCLEYFMQNSRAIRRFGSAAVDLAYTACGRFDSFFEYSLNPWDVAGGAFIVQEAGGVVTDFSGSDNYLHGKELIAGNVAIHKEVLAIIKSQFYG